MRRTWPAGHRRYTLRPHAAHNARKYVRIVAMAVVRMTRKAAVKMPSPRWCEQTSMQASRANVNTFLRTVYQIPVAILARSGFMARVGNQLISLLISAPGRCLVALSRSFIVDYGLSNFCLINSAPPRQ